MARGITMGMGKKTKTKATKSYAPIQQDPFVASSAPPPPKPAVVLDVKPQPETERTFLVPSAKESGRSDSTNKSQGGLPTTTTSRGAPATRAPLPGAPVPAPSTAAPETPSSGELPPYSKTVGGGIAAVLVTLLLALWFEASAGTICLNTHAPWADHNFNLNASIDSHCEAGWEGPCCDTQAGYSDGDFVLQYIPNDAVEHHMSYAPTERSAGVPASLHGIFWMDQRGSNVDALADHPEYNISATVAADELLVSFGESVWHNESKCLKPLPTYGGDVGHWSFMDWSGDGKAPGASADLRGTYELCFVDDDTIAIYMRYRLFGWLWITVPDFFVTLTMEKAAFGWVRRTKIGPQSMREVTPRLGWLLVLPFAGDLFLRMLGSMVSSTQEEYSYPMWQVVDGDGHRTSNYGAYLDYANQDTTVNGSSFETPRNRGEGYSLIGVPRESCYTVWGYGCKAAWYPPTELPWSFLTGPVVLDTVPDVSEGEADTLAGEATEEAIDEAAEPAEETAEEIPEVTER